MNYIPGPNDEDWRGTGRTLEEALDHAFARTLTPREDFVPTKWAARGGEEAHPVEWRAPNGAEVNIDWPHATYGPAVPHVGWQAGGKRRSGGARGHVLVHEVPYGR